MNFSVINFFFCSTATLSAAQRVEIAIHCDCSYSGYSYWKTRTGRPGAERTIGFYSGIVHGGIISAVTIQTSNCINKSIRGCNTGFTPFIGEIGGGSRPDTNRAIRFRVESNRISSNSKTIKRTGSGDADIAGDAVYYELRCANCETLSHGNRGSSGCPSKRKCSGCSDVGDTGNISFDKSITLN